MITAQSNLQQMPKNYHQFIFIEKLKALFMTIIEKERINNDMKICLFNSPDFNLMNLFFSLDLTGKGFIDLNDIKQYLQSQSFNFNEALLRRLIHLFDKHQHFHLNMEDFSRMLEPTNGGDEIRGGGTADELFFNILIGSLELVKQINEMIIDIQNSNNYTLFESFMTISKGNKYLDEEFFIHFLEHEYDGNEIQKLIYLIDGNNDKLISYEEFNNFLTPAVDVFLNNSNQRNENERENDNFRAYNTLNQNDNNQFSITNDNYHNDKYLNKARTYRGNKKINYNNILREKDNNNTNINNMFFNQNYIQEDYNNNNNYNNSSTNNDNYENFSSNNQTNDYNNNNNYLPDYDNNNNYQNIEAYDISSNDISKSETSTTKYKDQSININNNEKFRSKQYTQNNTIYNYDYSNYNDKDNKKKKSKTAPGSVKKIKNNNYYVNTNKNDNDIEIKNKGGNNCPYYNNSFPINENLLISKSSKLNILGGGPLKKEKEIRKNILKIEKNIIINIIPNKSHREDSEMNINNFTCGAQEETPKVKKHKKENSHHNNNLNVNDNESISFSTEREKKNNKEINDNNDNNNNKNEMNDNNKMNDNNNEAIIYDVKMSNTSNKNLINEEKEENKNEIAKKESNQNKNENNNSTPNYQKENDSLVNNVQNNNNNSDDINNSKKKNKIENYSENNYNSNRLSNNNNTSSLSSLNSYKNNNFKALTDRNSSSENQNRYLYKNKSINSLNFFLQYIQLLIKTESKTLDIKEQLALREDINLKELFCLFDLQQKNIINSKDFKTICRKTLKLYPTTDQVNLVFSRYDKDKDNCFNLKDFLQMIKPFKKEYTSALFNKTNNNYKINSFNLLSEKSQKLIISAIRNIIEDEGSYYSYKNSAGKCFDIKELWNILIKYSCNERNLDKNEINKFFVDNGCFFSQSNIEIIFNKMDYDNDNFLSFDDLTQEFNNYY